MFLDRRELFKIGVGGVVATYSVLSSTASISGVAAAVAPYAIPPDTAAAFAGAKALEGIKIKFLPTFAAEGQAVVVWADEIDLDGVYDTGGQPLALIARVISLAPGTKIVTSGHIGDPDNRPDARAADGRSDGANGAPGIAGGAGQSAAPIVLIADNVVGSLVLEAKGGDGGRGQVGGNGATGQHPAKAGPCQDGATGGKGGQGGAGGSGGAAGNGGRVDVQTITSLRADALNAAVNGGIGGKPGANGAAGAGGTGGDGGDPIVIFPHIPQRF